MASPPPYDGNSALLELSPPKLPPNHPFFSDSTEATYLSTMDPLPPPNYTYAGSITYESSGNDANNGGYENTEELYQEVRNLQNASS